jgi:hypothetical protein
VEYTPTEAERVCGKNLRLAEIIFLICRVKDLEGSQRSKHESEREILDAAAMREVEALRQKVVQLEMDIAGATAQRQARRWEVGRACNAQSGMQDPRKPLPAESAWHPAGAEGLGSEWWGAGGKTVDADASVTISLRPKKVPQLVAEMEERSGSRAVHSTSLEGEVGDHPAEPQSPMRNDQKGGDGGAWPGGSQDGGELIDKGGGELESWAGSGESYEAGESSGTASPWWTAEQLPPFVNHPSLFP